MTKNGRGRFVVMDIEDYDVLYKVGKEFIEIGDISNFNNIPCNAYIKTRHS